MSTKMLSDEMVCRLKKMTVHSYDPEVFTFCKLPINHERRLTFLGGATLLQKLFEKEESAAAFSKQDGGQEGGRLDQIIGQLLPRKASVPDDIDDENYKSTCWEMVVSRDIHDPQMSRTTGIIHLPYKVTYSPLGTF